MHFQPPMTSRGCGLLAAFALLLVGGCSGQENANRALDKSLAGAGLQKSSVYPLAGKVTVDGFPPKLAEGERVVVMLNDMANTGKDSTSPYVMADNDGGFVFHTYATADGVKAGTYIVTFAKLKLHKKKGLVGPDEFQNLYNDPEQNQKEYPELKIEHKTPGKKDYAFDLKVAGREPASAGPKALTHVVMRGMRSN